MNQPTERFMIDLFEDRNGGPPYLLDSVKVAELDATDLTTEQLEPILKAQVMLNRRWEYRKMYYGLEERPL